MDVDELKKLDKQLLLQEILNSGYLKNLNFWRFLLMNNSLLKKGKVYQSANSTFKDYGLDWDEIKNKGWDEKSLQELMSKGKPQHGH